MSVYTAAVEVGRAFVEQQQRCIVALAESSRIVLVAYCERCYAVLLGIVGFLFGPLPGLAVVGLQHLSESVGGLRHGIAQVMAVADGSRCRPEQAVDLSCHAGIVVAKLCQHHCVDCFLPVAHCAI